MTATTSRRAATPERWIAALDRAAAHGLLAFTVNGDPRQWFVTSGSAPGAGYSVMVEAGAAPSCGCKAAAMGDAVCAHRAAVLGRLGMLPQPAPAPVAVADAAARAERKRAALADLYGDQAAA